MRNILLGLLLLSSFYSGFGQTTYNLPPNKYYQKATIGFNNFQKIKTEKLVIVDDSIQYVANGNTAKCYLGDVNYIRIPDGNRGKRGAIIGGSVMLIAGLYAIIQISADPEYELKDNAWGRVAGYTAGGTLIGALIGSLKKKETSYYVNMQSQKQ